MYLYLYLYASSALYLYLELSQFAQIAHAKFPLQLSTVGGGVDEAYQGRDREGAGGVVC